MAVLIINETQRHEIEIEEGASVLSVLLEAQEKFWGPEVSIASLSVNGELIEDINEETLGAIPGSNATLELSLIEKTRSLKETLEEGRAYLGKLEAGFLELSSAIRSDNKSASYSSLKDAINGLSTMIDLLQVLRSSDDIPAELNREFTDFLDELNDKSRELNDAQENMDPILIADILEYEFVEVAQQMIDFLDRFAEYLPPE